MKEDGWINLKKKKKIAILKKIYGINYIPIHFKVGDKDRYSRMCGSCSHFQMGVYPDEEICQGICLKLLCDEFYNAGGFINDTEKD